jgi:homoserine kinase
MIRVRIPATTANLGPGFDCMGLALDLWNTFELHLSDEPVEERFPYRVETFGEGSGVIPQDESNLTLSILLDEVRRAEIPLPSQIRVICHNSVPCASGLGSSSTATLAGILFAAAMVNEAHGKDPSALDFPAVLARAVAIEGHGDNVAPALLGGFVIVVPDSSGVLTKRIPYVPIKTVVCVPNYNYLTTDARAALPQLYSKSDAIFNIGRAMLVAEALRSGDDELLARSMNDRIHEPYRLKSIPGASVAQTHALEAGAICVALSGAGPGIVAFARGSYDRIGRAMKESFAEVGLESRYWILDASETGVHVGRLPV